MKLLQALPRIQPGPHHGAPAADRPDYLFPAIRGGQLSDMALTKAVRDMHEIEIKSNRTGWIDPSSDRVAVVHGFRSTFRDWTAEMGYERDMAELALAHEIGSAVERAYRRTDMVERRRRMMQAWAQYCANVAAETTTEPASQEQGR